VTDHGAAAIRDLSINRYCFLSRCWAISESGANMGKIVLTCEPETM
jgi:hypothetical protein